MKECPRAEQHTSLPRRGVGTLSSVSHLTTKGRPCHVYSNSMPSKQIIGQTISKMEQPAASKSSPDSTHHSWMALYHHKHGVACNGHCITYVYAKMPFSGEVLQGCQSHQRALLNWQIGIKSLNAWANVYLCFFMFFGLFGLLTV